jgi:D-arabinose 1-dehydrogenase-like Zn-dependent alcohol dehydrogenase
MFSRSWHLHVLISLSLAFSNTRCDCHRISSDKLPTTITLLLMIFRVALHPSLPSGGCFAQVMRIEAKFAYKIPDNLEPEIAAPLMCAGGAVYEPIMDYVKPGRYM